MAQHLLVSRCEDHFEAKVVPFQGGPQTQRFTTPFALRCLVGSDLFTDLFCLKHFVQELVSQSTEVLSEVTPTFVLAVTLLDFCIPALLFVLLLALSPPLFPETRFVMLKSDRFFE